MNSYYIDKESRILCIALMILINLRILDVLTIFKDDNSRWTGVWLYSLYKGKPIDALELGFQVIN